MIYINELIELFHLKIEYYFTPLNGIVLNEESVFKSKFEIILITKSMKLRFSMELKQ